MSDSWRMHAVRLADGLLHHVGDRRTIEFCGIKEPVVEVEAALVEDSDPAATHWAWMDAKHDRGRPVMIYPRRVLFNVCFPYGPEVEQEHGRGRIVRLAVTEVPG